MKVSCRIAFALSIVVLSPCSAKEAIYLNSGFALEADSHTQQEETLICRIGSGTVELPMTEVARIESIPQLAVSPAPMLSIGQLMPEKILSQAAYLTGIDEEFVRSVAKVESGLRQEAVSPKGAVGLMQLMPATAAKLRINANQAQDNAQGGAKYLRELLLRYRGNSALALAAYNAGPEAVARYGGIPPYPETQRYVLLVLQEYRRQLLRSSVARKISKPISTN
jgi:Transglycosylase SLT domain